MSTELISASAGSGKTRALSERLSTSLQGDNPVRADGVVAVTFTRKAASELKERVRTHLISEGCYDAAQAVELGLVGTVHSVCAQLIREFAFDLGVSPDSETIPEGEAGAAFEQALTELLESDEARELATVARRLKIDSLQGDVGRVAELARSNGIAVESLGHCADESVEQLLSLLPKPIGEAEGSELDADLLAAITDAVQALEHSGNDKKVTQTAITQLQEAASSLQTPLSAPWHIWARLGSVKPAKALMPMVEPVIELAARHAAHARFQSDLESYTRGVFHLAGRAMGTYQQWKRLNRLFDFVDLETLTVKLLCLPSAAKELEQRLDLLLVDEFQDTNPIQLALFLQLAQFAGRVVWVGDEKQAIFGFRGSDPELLRAVSQQLTDPEHHSTLNRSWRSRPELVRFTSAAFTRGLAADGFTEDRVALTAQRTGDGLDELEPLEWWILETPNIAADLAAIAARVQALLAESPLVEDRSTRNTRKMRPGDVALLCRTNDECRTMAAALESQGVRAAVARTGLLDQLEIRLALGGLRVLLDSGDALAAAEVSLLTGQAGQQACRWLESRIEQVARQRRDRAQRKPAFDEDPWVGRLQSVRDQLDELSPSEAVDLVVRVTGLPEQIMHWGDSAQRLANVEKLRAYALEYEQHCRYERAAATVAGLLAYLDDLTRDARNRQDSQAEGIGPGAVQVLTYWRAKGLEWPVVILTGLDKKVRTDIFGAEVVPSAEGFDAQAPLEGRWIRLWPWPYGNLEKGIKLGEEARDHPVGQRVRRVALAESRRLLYVAMTRPRDQLILATREKKDIIHAAWLAELEEGAPAPVLERPSGAPDGARCTILEDLDGMPVQALVRRLTPGELDEPGAPPAQVWFDSGSPEDVGKTKTPLILGGSYATLPEGADAAEIGAVHTLGAPVTCSKKADGRTVGSAFHQFVGADLVVPQADRAAHARSLLNAYNLLDLYDPGDWVQAADRLKRWIEDSCPGASLSTEVPLLAAVQTDLGVRSLVGQADLIVRTDGGIVLIDHKCYPPDTDENLRRVALGYAPQLLHYATILAMASGKKVEQTLIHFPMAGKMMRVDVATKMVAQLS